jgi:hypothetical protein
LTATSVGFIPRAWSFSTDASRKGGIDFHETKLLEFSVVAVPADADCTIDAPLEAINDDPKQRDRDRRWRELKLIRLGGAR